ncbi:MAG: nucleotidyltransferase family protein [Ruminococcus sp.]|nr:nucleotidyltransferase family protein [Ruminococcus sp.]
MNKKFEDMIAEQGRLIYTNEGDSMYPIIRARDLLVIEAVKAPLKVGDVPLYKRDSGQYVLHRIVAIKKGKYAMKGDNRSFIEKGITDKHIIGVLTGIVRGGKTYPVETLPERNERIAKDVIYLLSCAVNEQAPDKERVLQMDLAEVYRLSEEHMLTAAVAFALEQVITLPRAFDQAKKKAIRKLALFEVERAAIARELENAGIWYLPLKGVLLQKLYPKFAMRQMSDNDILCDSSKMAEIRQIMERLGYSCELYEEYNHDTYSKPPTLEFEMHRSLFPEEHFPQYFRYFENIRERLLPVDGSAYCLQMTDEDFYLYFLTHTYKHYIRAGSGLRSLLDTYVFLRAHPHLNRAYLDAELKKLQIADFEELMRRLSHKIFTGGTLDKYEQNDLGYFISSGCAGTPENQEYNLISESLGGDDSKEAKRRFLRSRVFLSGEALKRNYPFFAKHKALYPVLFLYRPIKGALTHPKGILTEYKKIKHFKKKEEP